MFSFDEYKRIIEIIQASGKSCGYQKALSRDQFVLMRHDVEFSVDRAYELSKVELSMGFKSTYFFQWTNNTYNILSKKNMDIIKDMHERGQTIGLHFALNGLTDMQQVRKQILMEVEALSNMFGFQIELFSIHRPSQDVLRENIKLPGLLNAYQDDFFTFADVVNEDTPLKVKYVSDANHKWNYGFPDEKTIMENDKVQILVHPYTWTKPGYDNFNNFRTLLAEKHEEMVYSMDNDCKHFNLIKDQLPKEWV